MIPPGLSVGFARASSGAAVYFQGTNGTILGQPSAAGFGDSTPYLLPSVPPYNPPTYALTPTPDGTGQATHPSVVDFGATGWRGWRYWMGMTPYAWSEDDLENPSVLVSRDGFTWFVPPGLTNPIAPWPGGTRFNSDVDIAYDPDGDRLVCMWREADVEDTALIRFLVSTSSNGASWSAPVEVFALSDVHPRWSPALVRVASGDWRCFLFGGDLGAVITTSDPTSTDWSSPVLLTVSGAAMAGTSWHGDVLHHEGRFWMLLNRRDPWALYPLSSIDGMAWVANGQALAARPGMWDALPYRPTIAASEGDAYVRVWYGAQGSTGEWRIGYTRMPRDEWS